MELTIGISNLSSGVRKLVFEFGTNVGVILFIKPPPSNLKCYTFWSCLINDLEHILLTGEKITKYFLLSRRNGNNISVRVFEGDCIFDFYNSLGERFSISTPIKITPQLVTELKKIITLF